MPASRKDTQLAYVAAGLTLGAAAGLLPTLAITVAILGFGRPSSTAILGVPMALVFGLAGATIGALLSLVAQYVMGKTRWSGAPSIRLVAGSLVLIAAFSIANATALVRREAAANQPRTIVTTGDLARLDGVSALEPKTAPTLLYESVPSNGRKVSPLLWNGEPMVVSQPDCQLTVGRGNVLARAIDVCGFDYVREVVGVTARFSPGQAESLVLLARLRATGRRELLLVFDPSGALMHQELLERTNRLLDERAMWRSGVETGPSEVTIDLGAPFRLAWAR